jgi:hypothetical protein
MAVPFVTVKYRILVPLSAVRSPLAHGDRLGPLFNPCALDTGAFCEPIALHPANSARVEQVLRPPASAAPAPLPPFHEPAELIWFSRAEREVLMEAGPLPIRDGTLRFLPPLATHDFRLSEGAHLPAFDVAVWKAAPGQRPAG